MTSAANTKRWCKSFNWNNTMLCKRWQGLFTSLTQMWDTNIVVCQVFL